MERGFYFKSNDKRKDFGVKRFQSMGMAIILAGGLALGSLVCLGQPDATSYPDFKIANSFSRSIQQVTGVTPLSSWIANRILRHELSRHIKGHLSSRLNLFSGTDLLAGKARNLTLSGKNLVLDNFIPVSEFSLSSQPDMPIFASKTSHPILLRPVVFHLSMSLSEQDINRMLSSERGRQMLTNMKVKLPPFGLQRFDATNSTVHLDEDRVIINTIMNLHDAPSANALPMTISGKIIPDRSSLTLSDLDLKIEGIQDTQAIAQVVEHYFNELVDLGHLKVERHKVKVTVEQSGIQNGQVSLSAQITVTPDPKALKLALSQRNS